MRRIIVALSVLVSLVVALSIAPAPVEAGEPVVVAVLEGRHGQPTQPALIVIGKGLKSCTGFRLTPADALNGDPVASGGISKSSFPIKDVLVLPLPTTIATDGRISYRLALDWRVGRNRSNTKLIDVTVSNGRLLPGSVGREALADGAVTTPALAAGAIDETRVADQLLERLANADNIVSGALATGRFSAYDDLGSEGKVGPAPDQVAAGDHEHDARYPLRTDLSGFGTANDADNPVDWTKLKGIPSGVADGVDDGVTTAGEGLSLSDRTVSVVWPGTGGDLGADNSVARGDHRHDSRYFREDELNSAGTLNLSTNPMEWTRLKSVPGWIASGSPNWSQLVGVPSGFSDGVDNVGSAGTGLSLSGTALSVVYGSGSGTATQGNDSRLPPTPSSAGRILYDSGSQWTALNRGTNGQVLKLAAGLPFWDTDNDSGGDITSVTAGTGLTGGGSSGGVTLAIGFAGNGSASSAARSDHDHSTSYVRKSGDTVSGAVTINATGGTALTVTSDGTGLSVTSTATNAGNNVVTGAASGAATGVNGVSSSGNAVWGTTSSGTGVRGDATATSGVTYGAHGQAQSSGSGSAGVYGANLSGSGVTYGVYGLCQSSSTGACGVYGDNTATTGSTVGVYGVSRSSSGVGVTAVCLGSGGNSAALVAEHTTGSSGNIAIFRSGGANKIRIDKGGNLFVNGTTYASNADFAERVKVTLPVSGYSPGDVIVIDPSGERRFALSCAAESPLVAGVYSTKPAILAGLSDGGSEAWRQNEIPLAMVGIVPCKVCDEGGPIRAGDLLVTASLPGHAKRAPATPSPGTILAKALGSLDRGAGSIEVLLAAR